MSIRYKTIQIPPDIHRLNQIAEITIHPNLIPKDLESLQGEIEVYTSSNNRTAELKIPFAERILYGSLDFNRNETYFFLSNQSEITQCQSIRVLNRFNTSISVYNVTINNLERISDYIHVKKRFY